MSHFKGKPKVSKKEKLSDVLKYPIKEIKERGLLLATCQAYEIRTSFNEETGEADAHYFPHKEKGETVGFVRRDLNKPKKEAWSIVGDISVSSELFGQGIGKDSRKVTVVEGMYDGKARPEWRDPSKNGKYALVYGAQPPRLADTLSIPLARAEGIWNDFWQMNVSLGALKEAVEREWLNNDKVFITGLDGSKLYTRSQHSLVNTLFQNAGAVIMDLAGVLAEDEIERRGLDAKRVIYYHDEYAFDCAPDVVDEVGEIGVWSIKKAGEYFKLNVPLDADYSVGLTWGDVH